MSRLLAAMKTDVTVQVRNKLYAIGIGIGVIVAIAMAMLAGPERLGVTVPPVMMLVGGGSTLMYVAGMILFEKDEGTLQALIVSPLRPAEYLWAKITTLTALATLESVVMIGGAFIIVRRAGEVAMPNVPLLLVGLIAMGVFYTLAGIVMVVRYDKVTDFLLPMSVLAGALQIPFLYFWEVVVHPALLIVPTSAPTMLIKGAFTPLAAWEWVYGVGYTAAQIAVLIVWAHRAFQKHIVK